MILSTTRLASNVQKHFFVARPVRSMSYRESCAVTWHRIFLNEPIVQILVGEKCFQMDGEIYKADKRAFCKRQLSGVTTLIGWLVAFCFLALGRLSRCQHQSFWTISQSAPKLNGCVWCFAQRFFYHHWSSGLWLINNYGVREELSWGHINRGKDCCNFTSKSL